MATQGLVTVQLSGRVIMKVVAGCDGDQAQELAYRMQNFWPMSIDEVHALALSVGFGNPECLVVITDNAVCYNGADEIGPLYRATFSQPRFNPRWEHGTCDHVAVMNVERSVRI